MGVWSRFAAATACDSKSRILIRIRVFAHDEQTERRDLPTVHAFCSVCGTIDKAAPMSLPPKAHKLLRAVTTALAVVWAAASGAAADEFTQRAVNNIGAFWSVWGGAKAAFVADRSQKSGAAQRVSVLNPNKPWDAGTYAAVTKPVKKGDVLVLTFWARAEKPPPGSDLVMVSGRIYEAPPSGNGVSQETTFLIGKQWKAYYTTGIAGKDYPPGTLCAGMVLGTGDQVIDFGPVSILDMGPEYDVSKLPPTQ
jgi:hypothetical protein